MPSLANDITVAINTVANTLGITQTDAALARLDATQKAGAETSKSYGSIMATAAGIAAAAVVTIGVVAVKSAGDYQSALTRLVTSAGESTNNLKLVGDGMLQLARETGTSTKQLTDAMYLVESAGLHGADGLTVLKAAAQGAKAENADVGVVADAVSSVLQDYHLKASDAAMVTSKLITAISDGKTNFQAFAGSLSSVLPIASAAHVSLSDVTAALAAMTVHGMSADQASQDVAHSIQKMQSPTQAMTKYLAQLGINSADLAVSLGQKGITGTLQDISKAIMNHMGPAGKVLIDSFNQSKVAAEDANKMISAMPTNLQAMAKQFQSGGITVADFRKEIKALPVDQANLLTQFVSLQNSASGFNSLLKSGSPEAKTYGAALYAATGDATTLNTALMLTGENTAYVNKAVKDVSGATAEAGNNVKGWSEIQGNFNTKLAQFGQWANTASITLGMTLIPVATHAIDMFLQFNTVVGSFVANNLRPLQIGFTTLGVAIGTFAIGNLVAGIYSFVTAGGIATTATRVFAAALALLNAANPIVLAFTAMASVLTLVSFAMDGSKNGSNSLANALDRQRQAQNTLTDTNRAAKNAEDDLSHSKLNAEAASLRVEHAQINLTQAIKQYGPESLQARDASNELKQAQLGLRDAQQSVADKTKEAQAAQAAQAKASKAVTDANYAVRDSANGAAGGYANFTAQINAANKAQSKGNYGGSANIMLGIPTNGIFKAHATGTNSAPGGLSLVGENGPELVNMPRGAQVYTNHESSKMNLGGGTTNHFSGNIILGDSSAVTSFFKQIDQDSLLASRGMTVNRGIS